VSKGEPVMHMYIIFIVACFAYGAWSLYKHVNYLEDTVILQQDAIDKKTIECEMWKQSYYQLYNGMYQQPIAPRSTFPYNKRIIH
jgi:hypothetical protein